MASHNEVQGADGTPFRKSESKGTGSTLTDELPTLLRSNPKGIKREASAGSHASYLSSRPPKRVGSIHAGPQSTNIPSKQPPGADDEQQVGKNGNSKEDGPVTNITYSPFFRPKYTQHLDSDVSFNDMHILHLLLKRERPSEGRVDKFNAFRVLRAAVRQKGKESAPGAESAPKKSKSKAIVDDSTIHLNAYYLEICRAVAQGGWKTEHFHSTFPFLEDWKFSAKSQHISLRDWQVTLDYTPPKISPYSINKNETNADGTIKQEEIKKSTYLRDIYQKYVELTAGASDVTRHPSTGQITLAPGKMGSPTVPKSKTAAPMLPPSRPFTEPHALNVSPKTQKQGVELKKTKGRTKSPASSSSLVAAASQGFRLQPAEPVNLYTLTGMRTAPMNSTNTPQKTTTALVSRMQKMFADICTEVDTELKRRTTGPSAEQFKLLNKKVERIQAKGEIIQRKADQFEKVSQELREAQKEQESLREDNASLRQQLENMQKVKLEGGEADKRAVSALREENETLKKRIAILRATIQNLMEE